MKRKHEKIDGNSISVWDDGDSVADRFTVVYLDNEQNGKVPYLAMSERPFHPQGFGQHGEMDIYAVGYRGRGGAFEKRIGFYDLPADCQKAARQDFAE